MNNDMNKGIASIPRRTDIRGQDHMLAYIRPDEAQLLQNLGGSGLPGPGGVPEYGFWSSVKSAFSGGSNKSSSSSSSSNSGGSSNKNTVTQTVKNIFTPFDNKAYIDGKLEKVGPVQGPNLPYTAPTGGSNNNNNSSNNSSYTAPVANVPAALPGEAIRPIGDPIYSGKPGAGIEVPPGFTTPTGPVSQALVTFYNSLTGKTFTAPTGGYTPPEGQGWSTDPAALQTYNDNKYNALNNQYGELNNQYGDLTQGYNLLKAQSYGENNFEGANDAGLFSQKVQTPTGQPYLPTSFQSNNPYTFEELLNMYQGPYNQNVGEILTNQAQPVLPTDSRTRGFGLPVLPSESLSSNPAPMDKGMMDSILNRLIDGGLGGNNSVNPNKGIFG